MDTLDYLAWGGRCSSVTALIGNSLNLKPVIYVKDGKMGVGKKYRGKSSVYLRYVKDLEADLLNADPERIFIITCKCNNKIVEEVYDYIKSLNVFNEILLTQSGGIISCHCGPGTLGIMFAAQLSN